MLRFLTIIFVEFSFPICTIGFKGIEWVIHNDMKVGNNKYIFMVHINKTG